MTALPQIRMTVDEFLAWAEGQPGRYELRNGVVHAMSPEGAGYAEVKAATQCSVTGRSSRAGDTLPCTAGRHDGAHR